MAMFLSQLRSWWPRLRLGGALVALALIASVSGPAGAGAEGANHLLVSGAGRTIIEGGTGGASPVPVEAGGPGTTVVLEISGLTFHEILLEGQIRIAES